MRIVKDGEHCVGKGILNNAVTEIKQISRSSAVGRCNTVTVSTH